MITQFHTYLTPASHYRVSYTALAKDFVIDPIFEVGALFIKLVFGHTEMFIAPRLLNVRTSFVVVVV